MSLADILLGASNPWAQTLDKIGPYLGPAMSDLGYGLATAPTIGQAFGAATQRGAQMEPVRYDRQLQQNQMALAVQGRNATADWLANQANPNLQALAPAVRNGTISGEDALKMAFAPGQDVPAGSTLLPNPMGPSYNPGDAAAGGAANPANVAADAANTAGPPPVPPQIQTPADAQSFYTGMTPNAPIPPTPPAPPTTAQQVASIDPNAQMMPAYTPSAPIPPAVKGALVQALTGGAAALAPTAPTTSGAPAGYDPSKPFQVPATNPMQMTPQQRQDLGIKYGLTGAPLASFVVSGRLPANASQADSFVPASQADRDQWGISASDPQVYKKNKVTGELVPISGSVSTGAANSDALPPGMTGAAAIDPTLPGYATKPVAAGLTQAAIDQRALAYATSGTVPPVGRTGAAGAQATAITNRMAELDPAGNLAANKSQLKALTSSLANQQKYLDTTQRAVANAENGFKQVVSAFKGKVNPSQYPTINAMENAAKMQLSPGDVSAFKAGLQEVANEYTQVFSRGGQVTDAVRGRAADIVNGNLSLDDLNKVLTELQAQGDIVVNGAQTQVKQITDQINGIVGGTASSPPPIAQAGAQPSVDSLVKKYASP